MPRPESVDYLAIKCRDLLRRVGFAASLAEICVADTSSATLARILQ